MSRTQVGGLPLYDQAVLGKQHVLQHAYIRVAGTYVCRVDAFKVISVSLVLKCFHY